MSNKRLKFGDQERAPKDGLLLSLFDKLPHPHQKLVRNIAIIASTLTITGGALAWKLSEPQKKPIHTLVSEPLKSMRDDDIISLFQDHGINIYEDKNRIFFNLKGGSVGMRISEKFGKEITFDDLIRDPAFRLLFQNELFGLQESPKFTPPKAILVSDDVIPVATPVLESARNNVPKAIPVRIVTPRAVPVAIPVK